MNTININRNSLFAAIALTAISTAAALAAPNAKVANQASKPAMTSSPFKGVEVNGGTVSMTRRDGKTVLTLSPDFKIPKSPAPHWQVIDSMGNAYLLNQLRIAGDKSNLAVNVPGYVRDVAKVRIWCSFAEVNLGEASFNKMESS